MIRVLHVIGEMDLNGGAQVLLMNYYRHLDRDRVQFDFVVHWFNFGERAQFADEIESLGGKIYHVGVDRIKHPLRYAKWWAKFFRNHPEYKLVEGHIPTSAAIYLTEAKRAGCHTIAHSHSTWETGGPWLHGFLVKCSVWPLRWIADDFVGCSVEAGRDMFGKQVVGSDRFRVVNNVIDCERFVFSAEKREEIRKIYAINDALLIGHVGRFSPPKNHFRLLEIFKAVRDKQPSAKLMLVGAELGGTEGRVREKCSALGLEEAVIFAGQHENVWDYYSAMDVFCFPSLWEGLGNVAVEAQTNGLPCVASDRVPSAADIGAGLFETVSLKQSNEEWATVILAQQQKDRTRNGAEYARRAGYDAAVETEMLLEYYCTR